LGGKRLTADVRAILKRKNMRNNSWIFGAIFVVSAAGGIYAFWLKQKATDLPAGFARSNGRIEVVRVDIATKYAGRIAQVTADEGMEVEKGSVLARIDTTEILAQLAGARALVHRGHQGVATAQANVALRAAESRLADIELKRITELARTNTASQAELDRRTAQRDVSSAALESAKVAVEDAKAAVEVAEAQVSQIEAVIADMTLRTPVSGRVEYRLAQAGEIVAAGGRILTVLDISTVNMTIFLPTSQVSRLELGSQARIVFDGAPEYVVPATISFVAADAQFTPKYVETADEREKLMYRVKLRIDPGILETHRGHIKAGMTGNAYVQLQPEAAWPANLMPRLPDDQ
jgi:HlyD family secretion protein